MKAIDNFDVTLETEKIPSAMISMIANIHAMQIKMTSLFLANMAANTGKDYTELREKFFKEVEQEQYEIYAELINRYGMK